MVKKNKLTNTRNFTLILKFNFNLKKRILIFQKGLKWLFINYNEDFLN